MMKALEAIQVSVHFGGNNICRCGTSIGVGSDVFSLMRHLCSAYHLDRIHSSIAMSPPDTTDPRPDWNSKIAQIQSFYAMGARCIDFFEEVYAKAPLAFWFGNDRDGHGRQALNAMVEYELGAIRAMLDDHDAVASLELSFALPCVRTPCFCMDRQAAKILAQRRWNAARRHVPASSTLTFFLITFLPDVFHNVRTKRRLRTLVIWTTR